MSVLYKCDMGSIISHTMHVMHKINLQVVTDENLWASSYWVFLQTIFIQLLAIWDTIAINFPSPNIVAGFQTHMRHVIEVHATDEDWHDLLELIKTTRKPRSMKLQAFFYWLWELNEQVNWLLRLEDKLTDEQLNQVFFMAYPLSGNASWSIHHEPCQVILCFFREQQVNADQNQQANELWQALAKQSHGKKGKGNDKDEDKAKFE